MIFTLPNGVNLPALTAALTGHYILQPEPSVAATRLFYDTFDWRLYHNSLVLYQSGNELELRGLGQTDLLDHASLAPAPTGLRDLPEGRLKDRLKPLLEARALFKLVEAAVETTACRVLNQEQKTVVWLVYEEMRPVGGADPASISHLWLKPVRGYDKQAQRLAGLLVELGGALSTGDPYLAALAAAGKTPGDYSTRFTTQFDPALRADEAAKILLRFLLQVMQANAPYLKADIDPEFLHDFRVAVRRTRAVLGQLKGVFPADVTARFNQDFAFIGQLSNQLRDLDVYLLAEDTYRALLPKSLRADITPLFDHLAGKRAGALQAVIEGLNSPAYVQILRDWDVFLQEPPLDSPDAPNAVRPIIDLARARIYRRYRRLVKMGQPLLRHTDDKSLHALRIQGKKLRYLLEFFTGLFPADKIALLVKSLKQLQDNLGDYNDLSVQEAYLLRTAGELPLTDLPARQAFLAIGSLVGALDTERQRVKASFAQTFTAFTAPANKALFEELFKPEQKEVSANDHSGPVQP